MESKTCDIAKDCGSCSFQDMDYDKQLQMKTAGLKKIVKDKLNSNIKIDNIIGMDNPYNYRNKAKYVFGYNKKDKKGIMGFFKEGTHNIISCNECIMQEEIINKISKYIFGLVTKYQINIYNEDAGKGFLRHLIIKVGIKTNEVMVIFVTTDSKMFKREKIVADLIQKFPNIKTIIQNINDKQTNAILGDKNIKLYGNGYIMDYLGEYKFKISPLSFYQVNPIQTEVLYNTAIRMAELTGEEIIYDLYSGIGTISLFVSKHVKKAYGIEIVADAVKDAKENASINKVNNVNFVSGKVEMVLPKMYRQGLKPDVVFVDPPRSGLDNRTISTIMDIKPKKIIYISCNPETLTDNLIILQKLYNIKEIQPVDMFPFTSHVECVCVLNRR